MVRWKLNTSPWTAGLAVMMAVLCLMGAVGVSYARYQVNRSESIFYTPGQEAQIYLGQTVTREDGQTEFDAQAVGSWETVDGRTMLNFTVANGTAPDRFAQQDQQVQLRLAGTLGIWDGEKTVNVILRVPGKPLPDEQQMQYEEIPGKGVRIQPESPMYSVFGDGWVFHFLDENGKELSWLLEGGTFSQLPLCMVIEGVERTDASLFQLTATGSYVPDQP